jgi:hypothetical protein
MSWPFRGETVLIIFMVAASIVLIAVSIWEISTGSLPHILGTLVLVGVGAFWIRVLWRDVQRQQTRCRKTGDLARGFRAPSETRSDLV